MIIELLVNLKVDDGVIKAGTYDSSKRQFHPALQREIEIHKERGRRTLRIIKDDPAPSSTVQSVDETNTMDDESTFTTTDTTSTTTTKKPRRKRK